MSLIISILFCIICCVTGIVFFLFHISFNLFSFRTNCLFKYYFEIRWDFLGDENPCGDGNFKFLHTPGLRGGNCKKMSSNVICDRYISDGWYKVLHEDDPKSRKLMETRVAPNYCGTGYPIWLNGKFIKRIQNVPLCLKVQWSILIIRCFILRNSSSKC